MMEHKSKSVYSSKNPVTLITRRLTTLIPMNDIIKKIVEAAQLLLELDDNTKTLTEYFAIYMKTSDKLDGIKKDFKTALKEYSLRKIYTLLYTGTKILPKVYLMAILGSLIVFDSTQEERVDNDGILEEDVNMVIFKIILQDIMNLMKLIIYPTNSFCARYFVLNSIKNQLNYIDTLLSADFLLENLKGMNSSINRSMMEKPKQIQEDKTLTIFINENINALLSLPGMNKVLFKDKVLPEVLPVIYIQSERIYNEYILDWIISGLSEEFAVIGLEPIFSLMITLYDTLDTIETVDKNIPKKVKHFIDRLLNFLKSDSLSRNELAELHNHFEQLFGYLYNIAEIAKTKCEDLKHFMEFLDTVITFVLYCADEKNKASNALALLMILNSYLDEYSKKNRKLSQEHIEIYYKYCKDLLNNNICFFDIQILFTIAKHFKDEDRRKACYNILLLIIHFDTKVDSSDKVSTVLEMITIILEKTVNFDNYKRELGTINNIIKNIYTTNPEQLFQWYVMVKSIYLNIDINYIKESLVNYFFCFNDLIKNCEMSYLIQHNLIEPNSNGSANSNECNSDKGSNAHQMMDLSNYTTEKDLGTFLLILYDIPKEEMRNTFSAFPEINLKYLLETLKQINSHKICRDKMIAQFLDSLNTFIKILLGETLSSATKVDLTNQLIKIVAETSILPKEKYLMVGQAIVKIGKCLQKRTDTTKILLYSCELYYNDNVKDTNKIKELLENAFNEAEYVLVKIENLVIFPMILNKILYYADEVNVSPTEFVSLSIVNKIIQAIADNLPTAKEENAKRGEEVESLFAKCKEHIKEMKDNGVDYYQCINCDY